MLIESHFGPKSEDAQYYIDYMMRAFGDQRRLLHGAALLNKIAMNVSSSPGPRSDDKKLRAQIDDGRRNFYQGEFETAVKILEDGRRQLLERIAMMSIDQSLREMMHRDLLFLAHSYFRLKKMERAREIVQEAIRSFPDRDLSLRQYAPELVQFYTEVRRAMDQNRHGDLSVTTSPPGCMVFLNERFVGLSPMRFTDLYEGHYRVYIQHQETSGRVHQIHLGPKAQSIEINFAFDRALSTDHESARLRFEDNSSRRLNEVPYAAQIGRSLNAPAVMLIGFNRQSGRRALEGKVLTPANSKVFRSGLIYLEPNMPSPETLKAFSHFLLDGANGEGVVIYQNNPPIETLPPSLTTSKANPAVAGNELPNEKKNDGFFTKRTWRWITLGLAVASLSTAGALLYLDGRGDCGNDDGQRCPTKYSTATPGWTFLGIGASAGATTIFLF